MRTAVVLALVALLAAVGAAPVGAEEVAPGGGDAFGQHVAGMAPEHAIAHGAAFGACVSAMATTGSCPH
jgi:hypothetical protein